MANPINEALEEVGKSTVEMREKLDKMEEAQKKGEEARAKEKEIEGEKWNMQISKAYEEIKALKEEKERTVARLEIAEAFMDRPKGTQTEQLEQKQVHVWEKYVRSGMEDQQLKAEYKDLSQKIVQAKTESKADTVLIGTALLGGNAVPEEISRIIEKLVVNQSEIVQHVKSVTAGTSDYNELVTIRGANGGFVAEAGSRSQTNAPNIRKVTVTHGELYAYPKVSNWSLNDIFFNVMNWLQEDISDTFAVSLSTAIHSGDGSDKPTGMTNSAPTNADDYASPMRAAAVYEYIATGSSPVATALNGDDLIDLQVALKGKYQGNARFAMNSTTFGAVRKLKDSNNAYHWQPSYQAGQPDMLLGKPMFLWEDMANDGSANALPVAYGDFSRAYVLAKIGAMGMVRDEVTAPGYVNFFTYQRYGGIPLNNDSVKFLKLVGS